MRAISIPSFPFYVLACHDIKEHREKYGHPQTTWRNIWKRQGEGRQSYLSVSGFHLFLFVPRVFPNPFLFFVLFAVQACEPLQ
jgi:hypothetical protein